MSSKPDLVDYRFFSLFRVFFALCIIFYAANKLVSGYVQFALVEPVLHFHYLGFGWVKPLPEPFTSGVFVLLILAATVVASGHFLRPASVVVFLLYSYTILIDKVNYNNHYYLLALLSFYFCLGEAKSGKGPRWFLGLFRYQIVLVYFFAGVAKWNRDWLVGEPLGMWLEPQGYARGLPFLADPNWAAVLSVGGLALDLCIGPLLLWKKTRYPAMVLISLFHLSNEFLFTIGVFPAFMIASNLLFLGDTSQPLRGWPKFVYSLLALQLLLPLRHLLIPGMVGWYEDGHRYSWRMKLRSKRSQVLSLTVDDKKLSPASYLSPRQLQKIGGHPDLLSDFGKQLSALHGGATVRMHTICSLNGRPPQTFLSPDTDLSRAAFSPWKKTSWVEPLQTPYLRKNQRRTMRASLGFCYLAAVWAAVLGFLGWRSRKTRWSLLYSTLALAELGFLYLLFLTLTWPPLLICLGLLAGQTFAARKLAGPRALENSSGWTASLICAFQVLFLAIYGSIAWLYPV